MNSNDKNSYEKFITEVLDVLEDFDTELKQINSIPDEKKNLMVVTVHKRYQKYVKKIALSLKRLNIKRMEDQKGKIFDPKKHNAVYTENDKNEENDIILKVLSHGYYKNEKIIKFPKVVVNRSQ